jgi:hypothetical protein
MEVGNTELCSVLYPVRGCHCPRTSHLSQKRQVFADDTVGNPSPPAGSVDVRHMLTSWNAASLRLSSAPFMWPTQVA